MGAGNPFFGVSMSQRDAAVSISKFRGFSKSTSVLLHPSRGQKMEAQEIALNESPVLVTSKTEAHREIL